MPLPPLAMPLPLLLLLLSLPGASSGSIPNQHGQWRTDASTIELPAMTAAAVDELAAAALDIAAFEADYLRGSRPLRLTGAAANWSAGESWSTKARFSKLHGDKQRQARWAGGGNQFGILARNTAVRDYLAEMGTAEAAGREGLLFDRSLGRGKYWGTPPVFEAAGLNDTVVSVGAAGQGLPFHNHASAWQTVVVGRKAFLLLPPLSKDTAGGSWLRSEAWFEEVLSTIFLPSTEQFLQRHAADFFRLVPEAKAQLRVVVLGPGETLFVPCNWYHATINLEDTVAVGGQAHMETGLGRCAADVYGAASTSYSKSISALKRSKKAAKKHDGGEAGTLLSEAAELGEQACAINSFNFACPTHMATLMARQSKDVDGAVKLYEAAAARYGAWVAEGLLAAAQLSAVLASYAEELMMSKEYKGHRAAMELATELVQQAVAADPAGDNVKAQLSFVAYSLATATTPQLQADALEHAQGLAEELESTAGGTGGGQYCYQPVSRMADIGTLREQLLGVVSQAQQRFGTGVGKKRKKTKKARRKAKGGK